MHKLIFGIALVIILFMLFVYVETEFPFAYRILGSPNAVNDFANNVFGVTIQPLERAFGLKEDPLAKIVYSGGKK